MPRGASRGLFGVRLRGVTAYIVGVGNQSTVFTGQVSPPAHSLVVDEKGIVSGVAQGRSWADLARIQSRASTRPPDVVGTSFLRNLSPVTPDAPKDETDLWLIEIDRFSTTGEDVTQAKDVQLDILVMGIR